MFPETVGEPQNLLTVHPKLIFRGTLKKASVVTEDRSYQTQYFAKIFPSPLASSLQIHFYLHFQESSWNTLWIVIDLKSATFSAPKSAPETFLESTYFMLFLKNFTKNLEKKLVIKFVLMEQISFTNISFFYMLHLLLLRKTPQPCMHDWRKIVFIKSCLYFFYLKHFRLDYLYLKLLLESLLSVTSSQILKI